MRIRPLVILSLAASGCSSFTAPDYDGPTYALRRVGDQPLPVQLFPYQPDSPILEADTLVIPPEVTGPAGAVITHIRVTWAPLGERVRNVRRLAATREGDVLTVNECPIGSACIALATLVSVSSQFVVAGDSLYEQLPASGEPKPRVYSRVRFATRH